MKQDPIAGRNRTGIGTNPRQAAQMVEATLEFPPSSTGSVHADEKVRILCARGARHTRGLGSVPSLPGTNGAADATSGELGDRQAARLLDKLGERLAFERTGTRIYEALVSKHEIDGGFFGGPTRKALVEILNDEHRHFSMLVDVVRRLGGDPTAQTPSADAVGVMSLGVVALVVDPRTTLVQGLEALLLAELADRDGWSTLVELAHEAGEHELVPCFELAERTEAGHLAQVRGWIRAARGQAPLEGAAQ
jgi:rubrerythrin